MRLIYAKNKSYPERGYCDKKWKVWNKNVSFCSLSHGEKSGLIQLPEANEPTELYAGKNCGKRYGSSCR